MARPLQSTSLPLGSYVLSLVSHPDCIAAAASSPSDAIHLLDKSNLQDICALKGHNGGITGLRSVQTLAGTNGETLMSSGKDGTLKAWDHRSSRIAIKSKNTFHKPLQAFFDDSKRVWLTSELPRTGCYPFLRRVFE